MGSSYGFCLVWVGGTIENTGVLGVVDLGLGMIGSGVIGAVGWWRRVLAPSGVVGAIIVGTMVFAFGGLGWAALMVGFFALSSVLSVLGRRQKAKLATVAAKGARRDLGQVLANGGLGAFLAALHLWSPVAFPAFLGAMAAVNADTWSTEIGGLSRGRPRSIVNGRLVPPGTSGGVTVLGLLAALAGGLTIGLIALAGRLVDVSLRALDPVSVMLIGILAGLGGSVSDSVLGGTIQQRFRCPRCLEETERPVHGCGTLAQPIRGLPFVDNDVVNFLGSASGAVIGLAIAQLW